MDPTFYILLLFFAIVFIGIAFIMRDPFILLVGGILLFGSGAFVFGSLNDSGIEFNSGADISTTGDGNYNVSFTTGYRNAGNDPALNILGSVCFYGGMFLMVFSLVFVARDLKGGFSWKNYGR
jgi:hypothetical protein